MQLQFSNVEHTMIQATLAEGESLGNMAGPVTCFVPVDPANREYSDLLERGLQVAAFVPPS